MSNEIFRNGGPLRAKRIGQETYEMRVNIPSDEQGMVGRECPDSNCSPAYFKVKPGTGIIEDQVDAYCPYCMTKADPRDFITESQKNYAVDLLKNEAIDGVNRVLQHALGIGPSGRKKIGSAPVSIEMTYKPGRTKSVYPPMEEQLRRDVTCSHCGLEQAVFGLATWCADCGEDIFLIHLAKEFEVVNKMLSAVEQRKADLGARVAGRDVENALEDLVSIFEAVLKIITKRYLIASELGDVEMVDILERKVGNRYQNIESATSTFKKYVGFSPFEIIPEADIDFLKTTFEKRHPITHNLGVVDKKYLERVRAGELEGREIRISPADLARALEISLKVLAYSYSRAFTQRKKSS